MKKKELVTAIEISESNISDLQREVAIMKRYTDLRDGQVNGEFTKLQCKIEALENHLKQCNDNVRDLTKIMLEINKTTPANTPIFQDLFKLIKV